MARYENWRLLVLLTIFAASCFQIAASKRSSGPLTACQHLRRAEARRAKSLQIIGTRVRVPKCNKFGEFEAIQCGNYRNATDCWCVDEYGQEIPETRRNKKEDVICSEPSVCSSSSCRMFCPSGFARDEETGCSVCKCRDACDGIECPGGQKCQLQEVQCKKEPCPPIPTCKRARSLFNFCPAGQPLSISDTIRPFLCGNDPGKPQCPPLYECLVEPGNDYGVCCPNADKYKKPGICPNKEQNKCGSPCTHDLECGQMEKCCYSKSCLFNCQSPQNVTTCYQAKTLSEILTVGEREGRGYIPDCNGPGGSFSPKQCSRNGIVCWCVDTKTGHKIQGTMGPANLVSCDEVENMVGRSLGRSVNIQECDLNICAAVCEYGFKNDHNGCPSCECADPCEGFVCPEAAHCEVATDPECTTGSNLCLSVPVCKPDLIYSNPCEVGTPLVDNVTGESLFCRTDERRSRKYQMSFFDEDPKEGRSFQLTIKCPETHSCTKLFKQSGNVCCPLKPVDKTSNSVAKRQQSMCEYLRDFSERMEGTEVGMELAVKPPKCDTDGSYVSRQCTKKLVKVTAHQKRQILEQNMVRQMKKMFIKRSKRDVYLDDKLHMHKVQKNQDNDQTMLYSSRAAKIIDSNPTQQLQENSLQSGPANGIRENLEELEIEECWCVDNFGTEIPNSRGHNVTLTSCLELRETLECLDITCRMGCEYGFIIDSETKCPTCSCRDPCDGAACGENKECRTVEVSCEEEYCPPVPACMPRKLGQCPFLVPPATDNNPTDTCDYECRTDAHCDGIKRCCSNGCGTRCVEPHLKTTCQLLNAIQMHQSAELGVPAKQMYIVQCDQLTGKFKEIQCGANSTCWCVDMTGQEISGTRVRGKTPSCVRNSAFNCPFRKCSPCSTGYKVDNNGCVTCECRSLCDDIICGTGEECKLIEVECTDAPCPNLPVCVPKRETVCPEGEPLRFNDKEVLCGPQHTENTCPTTHSCHLGTTLKTGYCCTKTRDVCFESLEDICLAQETSEKNKTLWTFSPTQNKCIFIDVPLGEKGCKTKNLFNSELACKSVCPALTPCERLKLKNSLAAKRSGQTSVWFQPRCDSVTGHWNPVQCLEAQPSYLSSSNSGRNQTRSPLKKTQGATSVCWCADKKGAPLKGTLTRDGEPVCNHRQARKNLSLKDMDPNDFLVEELIRQMTLAVDEAQVTNFGEIEITERKSNDASKNYLTLHNPENTMTSANADPSKKNIKRLVKTATRCQFLAKTAQFSVRCNQSGAFDPCQCSEEHCWCVDEAGNQLPSTTTFKIGTKTCKFTPISYVQIQLVFESGPTAKIQNLYDMLRLELTQFLGEAPENLRVQELEDRYIRVSFELHEEGKVDTAFAIEQHIEKKNVYFANGLLKPDVTLSRFTYQRGHQQVPKPTALVADNTFQTALFVLATSSAFLISIFVVFVMLKRGKKKVLDNSMGNRILGSAGDKYLDYNSPIFVLKADEKTEIKAKNSTFAKGESITG